MNTTINETYRIGKIELTEENKKWYNRDGFEMTGELLIHNMIVDGLERETHYVVFKGRYTPYGMVRDCGDHYIRAKYASWDRIDKGTLKVTYDVKDM